jgi:hypothetical protein
MTPKPDRDNPDRVGELGREDLVTRLRREVAIRDSELADLRARLDAAEHELEDLRAIRDALTPFDMPERLGLDLAAAFVPAAERVSGDFYLVAEGPQDSTVLVIGDVVGHGLDAARRAAFVRTAFASMAPYSDDRASSWAGPTSRSWSGRVPAPTSSPSPARPTSPASGCCAGPTRVIRRRSR